MFKAFDVKSFEHFYCAINWHHCTYLTDAFRLQIYSRVVWRRTFESHVLSLGIEPVTLTLLASCSSSQALTETSNRGLAVHFPIEWLDVCLPSCLFVCGGVEKKLFVPPRKILTALLAFFPNQSSCHFDLSEVYISPRASESEKLLGEIFMSRTEGYKLLPGWWTYGSISRLDFSSRSRLLARQRE